MPSRRVTFVLPFDDSNEEDSHNSDFENIYKPEEEAELDLDEEILLFEDDIPDSDSEPEEGTSFINIKEYLAKIALIKPLELPLTKIPNLPSKASILHILKSASYYNNSIRIQALTLL